MSERELRPASPKAAGTQEWFRRAFDEFYVTLYAHRDEAEAQRLLQTLAAVHGLRGRVLDVACGGGRFLSVLRDLGCAGFGLDLSRPLLQHARGRLGVDAPLVRADMRRIPIREGSVDWVLLVFTSFGYFDHPEEDHKVLREIARTLRYGGRLVLDYLNVRTTVRDLVPESRRSVAGRAVREVRWVDATGPFLRKLVHVAPEGPAAPGLQYEERVRLYEPPALERAFRAAGLRPLSKMGGYDGRAFDEATSTRCILIAARERLPG